MLVPWIKGILKLERRRLIMGLPSTTEMSGIENRQDGQQGGKNAVRINHLWKTFYNAKNDGILTALKDVSLTVPHGQFVSICGPSGCGKSTLLRIIAGLESKTAGNILLDQADRPAVVFQDSSLFPWMTSEDNVAYRLQVQGMKKKERRQKVRPLMQLMGLDSFAKALPSELSGGMKQRLSVARALADHQEGLLLMDEPFGALDEQTRLVLQQELLRLWQESESTVLFITHSVDEAITLSDRVIVLSSRPGKIVADIKIPFERPRDIFELKGQPEFGRINAEIWELLRDDERK